MAEWGKDSDQGGRCLQPLAIFVKLINEILTFSSFQSKYILLVINQSYITRIAGF